MTAVYITILSLGSCLAGIKTFITGLLPVTYFNENRKVQWLAQFLLQNMTDIVFSGD
jgi:hypothetical protein